MIADALKAIWDRLDTRREPVITEYKIHSTKYRGYFADGKWANISQEAPLAFPAVVCHTVGSLIDYAKRTPPRDGIMFLGRGAISWIGDYSVDGKPLARAHRAMLPLAWDEVAAAAIKSLGKWLPLDQFSALMDNLSGRVLDYVNVSEALANLDGTETLSVRRSATGYQIATRGEVTTTTTMPRSITVSAMFAGEKVFLNIPLRVQIEKQSISLMLVNDGDAARAEEDARGIIATRIAEALQGLLVIHGEATTA